MFKKLLFTLISAVFTFNANAGQMANVEYIHQLIKQEHNIDIKYAPDLISPRQAANMKYLLTAVDVANEILNGEKTTDYGNGEFATRVAVDTTATIQAVRTLIKQENQFIIHTTPDTQTFGFDLRARGNFTIDWGDGTVQTVNKEWADNTWNWHEYATAGEYTIKLTGLATAYSENSWDPVVKFCENKNIARLSGSLGKIFPTMDSGRSPSFNESFIGCSNLTEIPENLFRGIATTTEAMFRKTFDGCSGLTEIPENLFAGFKTFTPYMFNSTFAGCTGLTEIPAGLFAKLSGEPKRSLFDGTFYGCTGLTEIPDGLFASVTGAPAEYMFGYTFMNCTGLSGEIPGDLFAGITGAPAEHMFHSTFEGCRGLTGIGDGLFSGIVGAPAAYMFNATFHSCSGLSELPDGLFAGISGNPADWMFGYAFYGCSGLNGIPLDTFGEFTNEWSSWGMFDKTFAECTNMIGESGKSGDKYLYEIWPDAMTFAYENASGLLDYNDIPTNWGGPINYAFTMTTTPDTQDFGFTINAAGVFYVDWGDGYVDTIDKSWTGDWWVSHWYETPGEYEIKLGGRASWYETWYTADISFESNQNLAKIDGSLGAIFPTINGSQPRFQNTFANCYNLSGEIPGNLFAGVSGAPADGMFADTFSGCSGLSGSIPEKLFAGISGAPATSMFAYTFSGCSNLSGSIPENLFAGVSGAPAEGMFENTFYGCSGLSGSIPENLFAGVSGAPAEYMFQGMFSGCSGLSGSIPANLFAGIKGAPASSMFSSTFYGCSGLSGNIPENLFAGVSGAPAYGMFIYTFDGCSGLSGSIPENLFAGISGAPAEWMFYGTFWGCSGLTGYIPPELFAGIGTDTTADYQMSSVFWNTGLDYTCPSGTVQYTTGFESWFDGRVSCEPFVFEPKFTATTTTDTTTFSFDISAAGRFLVDWGDGSDVQVITRTSTSSETYSHKYATAGEYQIKIDGKATGYNLDELAISFFKNLNLAKIDGSLGQIFSTLSDGAQPRFGVSMGMWRGTFMGCLNLTGSIPESLFSGITGAPANSMFSYVFLGCSGLTGSIPENLFAGITGAPASRMFENTFFGCSNLSGSIPENLFAGIKGAPAEWMFSGTFNGCSNLSGNIPENLFAGIRGAPAEGMFFQTFGGYFFGYDLGYAVIWPTGCTNLTGSIPENLFAGIAGAPASDMFQSTFSGCSGLSGYIPPKLFAGIGTDTTAYYQMQEVFYNTGLDTTCPAGTIQYMTGFEDWFDGRVSCEPYVFEPKFTATTTPDTTTFSFDISAAGRFMVDWGDGSDVQVITRTSTSNETYTHTYNTAGEYQIKFDGKATGYGNDAAISFYENTNLAKIDGSLGMIFSTLSDGTQPRFGSASNYNYRGTFQGCTNLTGEIPAELFSGISGAPAKRMFYNTFRGCSGLTGSIPENLFAGIKGAPASHMFYSTFQSCSGLSGNIPGNLFAGITGAPASQMFSGTFWDCSNLSGSIPENLFAGIKGAPASVMFAYTFSGCSGLSGSIPENLFAGIKGAPAINIFNGTFEGCSGLTGYIPPKLFAGIGTNTTASEQMSSVFSGTGLDTTCPAGTVRYTTGFESWFDGKVSCQPI